MSGPAYVVMPVEPGGAEHRKEETEKLTEALRQGLYDQQHPPQPEEEVHGPLKELLAANQDSLYRYISWENPTTTISSYFAALGVLIGLHYLPLTQLALKTGAVVLGGISITEWANRAFGRDTILARLRPKEYKKVPESTLNATLKDVHDFIQYSVAQTQRVLFAEDLDKSFFAFFIFAAMYWLSKIASPLTWFIVGLTVIYMAPLVLSPRGRAVGDAAISLSGDLAKSAAASGKTLAQDTSARVTDQYSRAQGATVEAAQNTGQHVGNIVEDGKQRAGNIVEGGKQAAGNLVESGRQTAGSIVDQGKQTAGNLSNHATNVVKGGSKVPVASAKGAGGSAKGGHGTGTGSLHVDDHHHQQHLNLGRVGPKEDTTAINQSGYRTSDQSNVVERIPVV